MIDFEEYTKRKIKAAVFAFVGLVFLVLGMVIEVVYEISIPVLSWVLLIIGLASFIYGSYLLNKLKYERENEGSRLYHYKGKFD
ncbi:MAG: hypothetical protein V2A62_01325 [Candidatus Woesearchaeota archaeon]